MPLPFVPRPIHIPPMALSLRTLTGDDYPALIALWKAADLVHRPAGRDSRERIEAELQTPHTRYLGLFDNRRLIGVVIATFTNRRAWIDRLAVHPDYRGKELAGQLLDAAEQFLREQGALVISALIEMENDNSIRAFEKHGYSQWKSIRYYSKRDSYDF